MACKQSVPGNASGPHICRLTITETGLSAWCFPIVALCGSAFWASLTSAMALCGTVALCGSAFRASLIYAASARHCRTLTPSSELPQAPNDERLKDAVAELREGPRELVDLYNEFACPWQQWGLALEMVEIANYSDTAYVAQLWDVYLRQVLPFCLAEGLCIVHWRSWPCALARLCLHLTAWLRGVAPSGYTGWSMCQSLCPQRGPTDCVVSFGVTHLKGAGCRARVASCPVAGPAALGPIWEVGVEHEAAAGVPMQMCQCVLNTVLRC